MTPKEIKQARLKAHMTQEQCAERFGYATRSWQGKEMTGPGQRKLKRGEEELLQLLADEHPTHTIKRK